MILPGKHLRSSRSLLGVGADILALLPEPRTPSELWERLRLTTGPSHVSFDWFVLSLSFLYAVGAVELRNGVISAGSER
jgi:hypothetical protein